MIGVVKVRGSSCAPKSAFMFSPPVTCSALRLRSFARICGSSCAMPWEAATARSAHSALARSGDALKDGRLEAVLPDLSNVPVEVHLVWPKRRNHSPRVRYVVDSLSAFAAAERLG